MQLRQCKPRNKHIEQLGGGEKYVTNVMMSEVGPSNVVQAIFPDTGVSSNFDSMVEWITLVNGKGDEDKAQVSQSQRKLISRNDMVNTNLRISNGFTPLRIRACPTKETDKVL